MKIVVCIKQVLDTSDIKWTKDNTINREGVESILNPLDLYALETALKIKDKFDDVKVYVVSMGPLQAMEIIKKAIALGCDGGYLLSDKKFAGADTFVTAKTLSKLILKKIPDFDLILCGQFAVDGDTAQTGPALAKQLDISLVTFVKSVEFNNDNSLFVQRETELNIEKYNVSLPAVLCVGKGDFEIRRAKISGFIKAKNTDVEILACSDIDLTPEEAGLKGSPTFVAKAFTPVIEHKGDVYFSENLNDTIEVLISKINEYV